MSSLVQIAAISGAAAADLPVKALPLPVPVATWTGGFIGAVVGGGFSQKTFIDNFPTLDGMIDASPKPDGWVGGLQVGYNYQINWLVLGVEGDFTWSGVRSSFSCFSFGAQTCTADPEWIADFAGRLGVAVGPALLYAKGGPAWIRDTYTDVATQSGSLGGVPAEPGNLFVGHNVRPGYIVGGGIEYPFMPNWAVRLEYDYMGFQEQSVGFNGVDGGFFTELIKQNMQMVTVGVDYSFGAPVVAPVPFLVKATPAADSDVYHITAFGGVDVSRLSVDAWGGALIAPWTDMDTSGARVWLFAGGGGYKYFGGGTAFHGIYESGDALAGYGFEGDNYSINLLGGLNAINDMVTPFDPTNKVQGTEGGFKVRGDAYITPTPQTMSYSEAEYSTAFQTFYLNQKLGYDVTNGKEIYVGPQATYFGDERFHQWRVGAHISNLQIDKVEIDISAGYADDSVVGRGAYSTVEVSRNF